MKELLSKLKEFLRVKPSDHVADVAITTEASAAIVADISDAGIDIGGGIFGDW